MAASDTPTAPSRLIEVSPEGTLTLRLCGNIDVTNIAEIEAALRQALQDRRANLVLDLREVTFLDSAGLRLILQARRWQQRSRRELSVMAGSGVVRHLLEVSGLTLILNTEMW
jgi:anti-anti-sigma factor